MTPNVGRSRQKKPRLFLLQQILPMKPYIFRLMADLRSCRAEQHRLKRQLQLSRSLRAANYATRRRGHDAIERLGELREAERDVMAEFRGLGISVGSVTRGELVFPCLVDNRRAYFVWYDSQDRPTHWRFRGDGQVRAIPEWWFSMFDKQHAARSTGSP